VEESLEKYGEYVALAFEGRQYTNVEQHRTAGRVANALRRLGVEPATASWSCCRTVPRCCRATAEF
jgi:hypothetical protein